MRKPPLASRAAACRDIADAIGGYLKSLQKHNDPIPPAITEDVIEVEL
jgi:predicted RNase H-like HicB family nuclease